MRVKVKNPATFGRVFGADCFIKYFPEILTTGIEVEKIPLPGRREEAYYYVMENGRPVNQTTFFSEDEMSELIVLEE